MTGCFDPLMRRKDVLVVMVLHKFYLLASCVFCGRTTFSVISAASSVLIVIDGLLLITIILE